MYREYKNTVAPSSLASVDQPVITAPPTNPGPPKFDRRHQKIRVAPKIENPAPPKKKTSKFKKFMWRACGALGLSIAIVVFVFWKFDLIWKI